MTAPAKLIIFLKAPRVGFVKTRLAKTLGARAATEAYRQLVENLLEALASLENVQLRFSPDDAAEEITSWRQPSWEIAPQGAGDLGQRLINAFQSAFDSGAQHVVIIGSDCPAITLRDIQEAWGALPAQDLVLGPARDGGYWLIALRSPQPQLFRDMGWSTETVLTETLRRARASGLTVHLLRELSDVDTDADWKEFLTSQRQSRLTDLPA